MQRAGLGAAKGPITLLQPTAWADVLYVIAVSIERDLWFFLSSSGSHSYKETEGRGIKARTTL